MENVVTASSPYLGNASSLSVRHTTGESLTVTPNLRGVELQERMGVPSVKLGECSIIKTYVCRILEQ